MRGGARLEEDMQAVQVSTHPHEGRRLLQAGNEGAIRAGRLRAGMRAISTGLERLTMKSI
jgi:hypothetical protein